MTGQGVTRKLTTIVSADVAGYSRLMGLDEEGTLETLKAHRRELVDPRIEAHRGRIVKTTGDGLLVEFGSVVDAVQCCLEVQRGMVERNKPVPDDRRIRFRVGINLGDIIIDGDDIFGDGVNIAARLESIADPGGICVSSAVRDQVRQKLKLEFEDLGNRTLKNIEEPVPAFRIVHGGGAADVDMTTEAEAVRADVQLPLPERPSLAIMPFRNLNGDAENEYIADGIALGIQTLLVQLSGIFFINATSDQHYREGTTTAAEAVGNLPVRYVLEGAVQRAGQRVRVTAKLTDLKTNAVVWADRYDRDLEDVFALQDDVTREVISSLSLEVLGGQISRIWCKELFGQGTWEYFLRGVSHFYKFTPDDCARSREMFEKIYELHPDKTLGPGYIALTHWLDATRGWTDSAAESFRQAAAWAEKAIVSDEHNDGLGHVIMGSLRLRDGHHDEALALCRKGVAFRANCPFALGQLAAVQNYCGDPHGAVKSAREALNVRMLYPPPLVNVLAMAYRDGGNVDRSIPAAREAARLDPRHADALVTLCSDYMLAGEGDEASRIADRIIQLDPGFRLSAYASRQPYKDAARLTRVVDALRVAGLPE